MQQNRISDDDNYYLFITTTTITTAAFTVYFIAYVCFLPIYSE